ncbi:MAG: hypothetical protein GF401_00255 [Chitinivibrionales bacterium]|nr:hypothetical protein [Chitinivibrionales bacterium]
MIHISFFRRSFFAVFLLYVSAFGFNHPEIEWKTVSTRHFNIHFYENTRHGVYAAAKIAEESYRSLEKLYDFKFYGKINLSLADYDDKANGLAGWTEDNILIWLPDARMDLRDNTTWLRNVITHELAHIISLRKSGFQLLAIIPRLTYTSPTHELDMTPFIPATQFFPPWFVEGIAQRESERMGHDCWDSRRDMVLRCAVLKGSHLTLQEMANFNHTSLGNEKVYNHGFAFVKYLENRFGRKLLPRLCTDARSADPGGAVFNRTFRKATGISLQLVYNQWLDSLKNTYAQNVAPGVSTQLWNKGTYNITPRYSAEKNMWGCLTNHPGDYFRTDLILFHPNESTPAARIAYAKTSWTFDTKGEKVFYLKSRKPNSHGSYYNDIYQYDLADGTETPLTRDARIYDVAACSDGVRLLCVQYNKGIYSLVLFNRADRSFEMVVEGEMGNPFAGVSLCPGDQSQAVVGKVINGNTNLYIVDITTGEMSPLCQTIAREEAPFWGPNNRIYYSADYDGVYNIYSIHPDASDLRRHSTTPGGLFEPVAGPANTLLCSEYGAGGFSLVTIPDSGAAFKLPESTACVFKPLPEPDGKVKLRAREYEAERLRPAWQINAFVDFLDLNGTLGNFIENNEMDNFTDSIMTVIGAGIGFYKSDALRKRVQQFNISFAALSTTNFSAQDSTTKTESSLECMHSRWTNKLSGIHATPAMKRNMLFTDSGWSLRFAETTVSTHGSMQSETDNQDSAESEALYSWIPLIVPELTVENRKSAPTFGFMFQSQVFLYIPVYVLFNPYIQWHVARDFYIGASPQLALENITNFSAEFPLWFLWTRDGYYNEDISYNLADLSMLRAAFIPMIVPVRKEIIRIEGTSTETVYSGGKALRIAGMHSFPIKKYFSLLLEGDFYPVWLSETVQDPFDKIDGYSDSYFSFDAGVNFIFPLFRYINRGNYFCADALYGRAIYELSLYGNRNYALSSLPEYISEKYYDPSAASTTHRLGGGLTFGYTQSYSFFQQASFEATWDLWRNEVAVKAALGF